jgi:hypothetical protein
VKVELTDHQLQLLVILAKEWLGRSVFTVKSSSENAAALMRFVEAFEGRRDMDLVEPIEGVPV